ncbi:MAG: ice-binding family protein [Xanthobacteraceae bacterium]
MEKLSPHFPCTEWARAEADPDFNIHVSGFSSDPTSVRAFPAKLTRLLGTVATLGLMVVAPTSPSHAQNLGTAANFAVLGGSTVTNTGPSVLIGDLGVSPGSAITGFPPGIVTPPSTTHAADAVAVQAQVGLTTAYNALAGLPPTANLTGQNLGGLTLTPGVYNFNSSAQLTGALTLNAQGNPNAVFIFKIGSTLTTASSSTVSVIGGGQGANVFWQVGSSATLGTTTTFVGDILALTSITLNTGANIACGSALAHNGAVTLDTNHIAIGSLAPCTTPTPLLPILPVTTPTPPGVIPVVIPPGVAVPPGATPVPVPPGTVPPGTVVVLVPVTAVPPGALPLGVTPVVVPATIAPIIAPIDTAFVNAGGSLPAGFLALSTLSPSALTDALLQLSGQAATAAAPTGILAMSSFLSLVTNPFADRGFPPPPPPLIYKTLAFNEAAPDPSRWGIWAAAYGGLYNIAGNSSAGTSAWSASTFGAVIGLDYRVTPYTMVGVALAGGSINFGLSGDLGGGSGQMFQAAVYSLTRVNAAYVSAALAYGWYSVSTSRDVTLTGSEDLTAAFAANDVGGRIEGGYRFAIPGVFGWPGFGFTPYGALQAQSFMTPAYQETGASGASAFALAYNSQTTSMIQTELGAWFDETIALDNGASLALWTRAAWAYDRWSGTSMTAAFESLPGSSFPVFGAVPGPDSLLASVGAQISFKNGISLAGEFDSQLSESWQTYGGFVRLRYTW